MLAVVFANPFVNSALGLEVVPIAAFLTGLTAQAVAGRRIAFGVLAGLLVLTRPDLGIVVAVMYLLTPAIRRRFFVAPLAALAVAVPWWAFSWYHFGSAIPTTLVIKTLQKSFGEATFGNGLQKMWEAGTTLPLLLALVPAAVGLVTVLCLLAAAARRRLPAQHWPLVGLGIGGLAEFGAYCALGVPPYHWYYVSSTVALGITGVFGLALLLRPDTRRAGRRPDSGRRGARRRRRRIVRGPRRAVEASGDLRELGATAGVHGDRRGGRRTRRRCHRQGSAGDRHGGLRV